MVGDSGVGKSCLLGEHSPSTITINVGTCCLYGAGRNDFDAGNFHYDGPPLPIARVMDLPASKSLSPSVI
jgi:GTPase SAR1 family protein